MISRARAQQAAQFSLSVALGAVLAFGITSLLEGSEPGGRLFFLTTSFAILELVFVPRFLRFLE